jgi:hypothetical protein
MIEFSNPAALWLLTLSIPLILLYILKRRRRELIVPSTLLWKQALEDMRAETPFQKLRSSLLLMLQLLILVLITAILSGPQFVTAASLSRRWILVMDCSASMKTKDVRPSRFVSAKEQLIQRLNDIPASDVVMVLSFSSETSIVQQFTDNFDQARERLDSLTAEDLSSDWRQLIRVLEPLVKENPPPRVMIASDFANVPSDFNSTVYFDPILAGESGNNVGITRVACKPVPGTENKQSLLYQIKNFSKQNVVTNISLLADESVIDAFEIQLNPNEAIERTAEITVTQPSKVRIEIKPNDIFTLDDDFVLIVEPAPRTSINLTYDNPYLRKALEVLPSVRIQSDGVLQISKVSNIETAKTEGIYFLDSSEGSTAPAVYWREGHPILQFVDARAWKVRNAKTIPVPPGGVSLVEVPSGTIAYAIENQGVRKIILTFPLEESNLPSLAGFPVFLQNSIQWIQESKQKTLPQLTGGSFRTEGSFNFDEREGYVNFANVEESAILPGRPISKSGSSQTLVKRKTDIAAWFLVLATGFVVVEWWAFHRRVDA